MEINFFDYSQEYKHLKSEIFNAIENVFDSGKLILADQVSSFQENFTCSLGDLNANSVGVNSGTDALIVALMAHEIGNGDEVITVANTAIPTISAIRITGATPIFCDVDSKTALIDMGLILDCITPKTKAIIPVHLFGNAVDVMQLRKLVKGTDIVIIEDCAQAHGARVNGKLVGTLGHSSAFSFYPTKILGAYGDAGICFTKNYDLYESMLQIRTYGFNKNGIVVREGINSRMDEIQAAILNVKLPYLEENIKKRQELADYYNKLLNPGIRRISTLKGVENVYHLFVILTKNREHVRNMLIEKGIITGIHYPNPAHLMEGFSFLGYKKGDLPVTELLSSEVLSLPLYPELKKDSIKQVCAALNSMFEQGVLV